MNEASRSRRLGMVLRSLGPVPSEDVSRRSPKMTQIGPGAPGGRNLSDCNRLLIENLRGSGGLPNRRICPPPLVVRLDVSEEHFCCTSPVIFIFLFFAFRLRLFIYRKACAPSLMEFVCGAESCSWFFRSMTISFLVSRGRFRNV